MRNFEACTDNDLLKLFDSGEHDSVLERSMYINRDDKLTRSERILRERRKLSRGSRYTGILHEATAHPFARTSVISSDSIAKCPQPRWRKISKTVGVLP